MQNVGSYAQTPTFQTQRWRVKASALARNWRRFDTSRRKRLSSRRLIYLVTFRWRMPHMLC